MDVHDIKIGIKSDPDKGMIFVYTTTKNAGFICSSSQKLSYSIIAKTVTELTRMHQTFTFAAYHSGECWGPQEGVITTGIHVYRKHGLIFRIRAKYYCCKYFVTVDQ